MYMTLSSPGGELDQIDFLGRQVLRLVSVRASFEMIRWWSDGKSVKMSVRRQRVRQEREEEVK